MTRTNREVYEFFFAVCWAMLIDYRIVLACGESHAVSEQRASAFLLLESFCNVSWIRWRPRLNTTCAQSSRGGYTTQVLINGVPHYATCILAEGAMTLPVTPSGGVLFAS